MDGAPQPGASSRPHRTRRVAGHGEFQSLFGRLGGRPVVDEAIEVFYARLLADERVAHFFDGVDTKRLRATQQTFLTWAFGGPVIYDGPGMRDIHRRLDLTEDDFRAVTGHLRATLQELLVPGPLIEEVMAITDAMHDDVLNL